MTPNLSINFHVYWDNFCIIKMFGFPYTAGITIFTYIFFFQPLGFILFKKLLGSTFLRNFICFNLLFFICWNHIFFCFPSSAGLTYLLNFFFFQRLGFILKKELFSLNRWNFFTNKKILKFSNYLITGLSGRVTSPFL